MRLQYGFLFIAGLTLFGTNSCLVAENQFEALPPGLWRGVLQLDPTAFVPPEKARESILAQEDYTKELPKGTLPFQFEVIYDSDSVFHIEIINGTERIKLGPAGFGRNIRTAIDTVYFDFPVYDSYIQAQFRENVIDGYWVVRHKKDYRIPFVAAHGEEFRYPQPVEAPIADISGKWEVVFSPEEDPYPAIGEFQQDGNMLTGTFLTETGDFRFLEGIVEGDDFSMSVFDGAHAFVFEGKISDENNLIGSFRSGKHYQTTWTGIRNSDATIQDPDSLTYIKPEEGPFTFSFPNEDGKVISLEDPAFEGKTKIVQILGTWCPNCRDETIFLREYLKANPDNNLAIIGLAFERYKEEDKARAAIKRYREKLELPYPILHAGISNKQEAAKSLPMLNHILSYPTMIFLDKDNNVKRIHTGFAGPATSAYEEFVADFETFLKELD